jgi:beta-galactosidase
MDYIGEAGIGRPMLVPASRKLPDGLMRMGLFYMPSWPVFNAFCGDLDLIGNKKPASYYQDVVWRRSPIEMLTHRPVSDGMQEVIAPWGFPDELKSWTWPAQEGKKIQVNVYSRSKEVKLELNGNLIAEQTVADNSITAKFEIEYQPGMLVAKGFDGGKETGSDTLLTAGKPFAVRLVADRSTIKADLNDLAYVSAEIVDEKGNVVPYIDDIEITYQLSGNATIAGVGNGSFDDASSFQQNHKKVYQGRGLVIIRPKGLSGKITLKANAKGLKEGTLVIILK